VADTYVTETAEDDFQHLLEEKLGVIPEVPLRQWVLSVPVELRLLLARDPRALTAVGRIFVQEARLRRDAGLRGLQTVATGESARGLSAPPRDPGRCQRREHGGEHQPDAASGP